MRWESVNLSRAFLAYKEEFSISCKFHVHNFPRDQQKCKIQFGLVDFTPNQATLKAIFKNNPKSKFCVLPPQFKNCSIS